MLQHPPALGVVCALRACQLLIQWLTTRMHACVYCVAAWCVSVQLDLYGVAEQNNYEHKLLTLSDMVFELLAPYGEVRLGSATPSDEQAFYLRHGETPDSLKVRTGSSGSSSGARPIRTLSLAGAGAGLFWEKRPHIIKRQLLVRVVQVCAGQ